jgi:predicted enzyme related to lactoylglutathione lyase
MFKDVKAFSSFSVDDLAKAKEFYTDVLGLKVDEMKEMELLNLHLPGGGKIMVYLKGKDHKPAVFTILNFPVKDVEETVDTLIEKGIKLERYEGFDQDEKGISRGMGVTIAWFTDPAGNILSVMEESK